ncbi:MAG: riboflavin synthase [Terriglobia bacterium]
MFTGIIEEVGRVVALETTPAGGTLRVEARKVLDRLSVGMSIAVNGACLTVTSLADGAFLSDLSRETLARTSFRTLKPGRAVNLELPVTPTTSLGGHIVQGHVDGAGTFLGLTPAGNENYWLDVDVPGELLRYLVEKGSVAVDGISLTVAELAGTRLRIAIIPFTYENSNLRTLQPGDRVNLECDVLAKYVEKLLQEQPPATTNPRGSKPGSKLTRERLRDEGF